MKKWIGITLVMVLGLLTGCGGLLDMVLNDGDTQRAAVAQGAVLAEDGVFFVSRYKADPPMWGLFESLEYGDTRLVVDFGLVPMDDSFNVFFEDGRLYLAGASLVCYDPAGENPETPVEKVALLERQTPYCRLLGYDEEHLLMEVRFWEDEAIQTLRVRRDGGGYEAADSL